MNLGEEGIRLERGIEVDLWYAVSGPFFYLRSQKVQRYLFCDNH